MAKISREISKGQLVPLHFFQDNVAASQTDANLVVLEVASAAGHAVASYSMPWEGEIVGISYDLSAAATAGTLTVGATISGTEDADTTQTITTAQRAGVEVERGKARFAADSYIGAQITTDGSWNATTADLAVTVWVLLYLKKI